MKILVRLVFLYYFVTRYAECLDFSYHKYAALTSILKNFTSEYAHISSHLKSVGTSIQKKQLWMVEVTAANKSKIGTPNVKLIGNIHGNEAVGREILLHFLEFLGDNYGVDPNITWLLENTRIYVLPSMNPDGFEISNEGTCFGEQGRCNSRQIDLNRNFPDIFSRNRLPTQPESAAIQNWMEKVPFILSASLHGGALVANYPFDTVREMKWEKLLRQLSETNNSEEQQTLREAYIASLPYNPPSVSPDEDVFVHLAKTYSNNHPTMHLGKACPESKNNFTGGITNGAAWYPLIGGMQDFNYGIHGCFELTLEISCCKYPRSSELPQLWQANKYPLLEFIKQAHRGVRGIIFDRQNRKPVVSARLNIVGRDMYFKTYRNGEFWRILLPGKYELQINATGYHIDIVPFEVIDYGDAQPQLTTLYIPLINQSLPRPAPPTPSTSTPSTDYTTTMEYEKITEVTDRTKPEDINRETPIPLQSTAGASTIIKSYFLILFCISLAVFCKL